MNVFTSMNKGIDLYAKFFCTAGLSYVDVLTVLVMLFRVYYLTTTILTLSPTCCLDWALDLNFTNIVVLALGAQRMRAVL